jgi:Pectate lyase superfamily protein/Carboxypeptidase regulatory-like domain
VLHRFALTALILFNALSISASGGTVLNVSDFGAVGDGVTDDGPAFQSALDALADAGGGTLFVPAGRYLIKTPVSKDFSALTNGEVTIQGVPSDQMPAPPTADGDDLAAGLALESEIIPATGPAASAITISHLKTLAVEHLGFAGRPSAITDAFITLNMRDIVAAKVYHCEFYGISTVATLPGLGGGNLIRATRSNLSIEQSSVLGSTANSGTYAPIVENLEWHGFNISNSIFIDYGLRAFFGKMGMGSPLSWINFGGAAKRTPQSLNREIVIRDTFFDEGGWIGITAYPHRFTSPVEPVEPFDLLYISGLKMNVSNFGTAGHQFFSVANVMIENSHYGWSRHTGAAIDIIRSEHVILDRLTCVLDADRIRADARTKRLTVINSEFGGLDSLAETTTVLETPPAEDPVQFVRQQFLSLLGREPEPADHFYWSDLLIKCGDQACRDTLKDELEEYLNAEPQKDFVFAGTVTDENNDPLSGATVTLSGSRFANATTNQQGNFQFLALPTSGVYTLTARKKHYTFTVTSETFERPARNVTVAFRARLNRHSITGRIGRANGTGAGGVTVQLAPSITTTTDANGNYAFPNLAAGENYTVVPSAQNSAFFPARRSIVELSADTSATFAIRPTPQLVTVENSENALVFDSATFVTQPFSIVDALGFSNDGINRLMLFARNLEGINDRSQFSVVAEDAQGQTYPLQIELMADVPRQNWLKQFNVRLSPELSGKCVRLRLTTGEVTSNTPRICFR